MMNSAYLHAFLTGFLTGAKATPKGFFAPAVAIWDLLIASTERLTRPN